MSAKDDPVEDELPSDLSSLFETANEDSPMLNDSDATPIDYESLDYGNGKTCYLYYCVIFASFGGFLNGCDTGMISEALIPLKRVFNLSIDMQQFIVSLVLAGAILGTWLSGIVNAHCGRRCMLLFSSALFTVGYVVLGAANGIAMLIVGRTLVGFAVGFTGMTAPIYIAEASPPSTRGRFVTAYQLQLTCGIFISSILSGAFAYLKDGWRYMLGFSAVPSLIMFVGCVFVPESPRWLIQKGRTLEAKKVLQSLRGKSDVGIELKHIQHAISEDSTVACERNLWRIVTTPGTRHAFILGCGLQVIQGVSGIYAIMYYRASIIQLAGVQDEKLIIWLAAAVAFGNMLFTFLGAFLTERVGRRKLTLFSVFCVAVSLALIALTFYILDHQPLPISYKAPSIYTKGCSSYSDCSSCVLNSNCGFCYIENGFHVNNGTCLAGDPAVRNKHAPYCSSSLYENLGNGKVAWKTKLCPSPYAWLSLVSMLIFLAAYAPGLGPMPWTINAEIYPMWARNECTSVSISLKWIINLAISLTFLSMVTALTRAGIFVLYAGLTFGGFLFLYFLLPETKGKKLEEIAALFGQIQGI